MDDYRRRPRLSERIARMLGLNAPARPEPAAPDSPDVPGRDPGPGSLIDHLAAASRRSSPHPLTSPSRSSQEVTAPLSLERVEAMLTDTMGYRVQRHKEEGHSCLLGIWNGYPFVIEEPLGHQGWLLVAGDREEPVRESDREEIAASVNDWNRDRFFPTMAITEVEHNLFVRAIYLVDLSAGATDAQLRLHLDTALGAGTQALAAVRPLLPEI